MVVHVSRFRNRHGHVCTCFAWLCPSQGPGSSCSPGAMGMPGVQSLYCSTVPGGQAGRRAGARKVQNEPVVPESKEVLEMVWLGQKDTEASLKGLLVVKSGQIRHQKK